MDGEQLNEAMNAEMARKVAESEIDTGVPAPEKVDARWLYDFDYLWLTIEAELRGGKLYRSKVTGNWTIKVKDGTRPFMNDKGIKDVMAVLRSSVNVVTGTSILGEDRVLGWCERMQYDLADMLYVKQDEYELESSKYMLLISILMVAFEGNLRKSINGRALTLAMEGERVFKTETSNTTPNPGLIGSIFGGGRR